MNAKGLLKLTFSCGCLLLLTLWVDWRAMRTAFRTVGVMQFTLSLVLLLLAYLSAGLRLWLLGRANGIALTLGPFAASYYMGLFFNYLLPSGVGGDAVRVFYLARRGYDGGMLVATSIMDRYLGLATLLIMAGVALLVLSWAGSAARAELAWLGAALLLMPLLGLPLWPRLVGWTTRLLGAQRGQSRMLARIARYWDAITGLRSRGPALLLGVGLSFFSHGLIILSYAACGYTVLPEVAIAAYFIAVPVVMLAHALPISVGGLGVREAATVAMLVWLGADKDAAFALALVFLGMSWISVLPGLLISLHLGVRGSTATREH
jgi:uncharacterized protein (TIRG00374 family)